MNLIFWLYTSRGLLSEQPLVENKLALLSVYGLNTITQVQEDGPLSSSLPRKIPVPNMFNFACNFNPTPCFPDDDLGK